jgi:EAL domain-containing protein (putative c-di-GMP-specific phosphodiesterase class I)
VRAAFERQQLVLAYEPVVDTARDEVVSAVARLHWHHPERGLLEASDLRALAEQGGVARRLSRWTLEQAIRACSAWQQAGVACGVAVPLNAEDLRDVHVLRMVAALLECWRLPAERLTLEIAAGIAERGSVLADLAQAGVRLAIADPAGPLA